MKSTSCLLHNAGFLAQKRLARGVRLNYPECVALIATQLLEFIRDGRSVAELMDLGRQFLGRKQVMTGVPEMIARSAGRRDFSRRHQAGDSSSSDCRGSWRFGAGLVRKLSCRCPDARVFETAERSADDRLAAGPTARRPTGELVLNAGRETHDDSKSAIWAIGRSKSAAITISSKPTANWKFDRAAAYGKRLDIPAGTAVRFEPATRKPSRWSKSPATASFAAATIWPTAR